MRAAPWQERRGSEQEHGEERVDSTVKEGRFQNQQPPPRGGAVPDPIWVRSK